jgi:hypothetical protein
MSQPPIPPPFPKQPLEYQSFNRFQPPPLDYSPGKRFGVALLIGTGLSALIYIAGSGMFKGTGDAILIVSLSVVAIKFVTFISCMFLRRWRTFGVGILVSIALGFMIFFGVCTMNIGSMH